jgi:molecular chaperone DnaK
MPHSKIDYGIDLGTTNSSVCRMEHGVVAIMKSDTLADTTPSCVSINRKNMLKVGTTARNNMQQEFRARLSDSYSRKFDAFVEFKRTMGTDHQYESQFAGRNFSSEELSAEVLKTLKSYVTDEDFSSVVITVPAKFTVNQKNATIEAARMAGFRQCELLQEPVAAAMAYGIRNTDRDGIWLVFDFGGGTFDAALLRAEDGILQVFDTEGDNYLGGKDLDYAIVDGILLPYLKENYSFTDGVRLNKFRDALKSVAEEIKNQLSLKTREDVLTDPGEFGTDDDGEDVEIDLAVSREQIERCMEPVFQKAVDICRNLLSRNNIDGGKISRIILVGGPTKCPIIRRMLTEQISKNVDCSIDPMTPVAVGAALYASTIDLDPSILSEAAAASVSVVDEKAPVNLNLGYESTSIEDREWVTLAINEKESGHDRLQVEIISSDETWSTGRQSIDHVGNVFEVELMKKGKPNAFEIRAFSDTGTRISVFPDTFTIIHGTRIGAAPLPYNIAIAVYDGELHTGVIRTIPGLEKNRTLPAHGEISGLRTTSELRIGNPEDNVKIPIYQVDGLDSDGSRAKLYEYVGDVLVLGSDVDIYIPSDTPVTLKIRVDTSEMMRMEVSFTDYDLTVEKELNSGKRQKEADAVEQINGFIRESKTSLDELELAGVEVSSLRSSLDRVISDSRINQEKKAVLQHMKEVMRNIEAVEKESRWIRARYELDDTMRRLRLINEKHGNEKSSEMLQDLESQVEKVSADQNVTAARMLTDEAQSLIFELTFFYQLIRLVQELHQNFESHNWKDRRRAGELINRALLLVRDENNVDALRQICLELLNLLPRDEISDTCGLLK